MVQEQLALADDVEVVRGFRSAVVGLPAREVREISLDGHERRTGIERWFGEVLFRRSPPAAAQRRAGCLNLDSLFVVMPRDSLTQSSYSLGPESPSAAGGLCDNRRRQEGAHAQSSRASGVSQSQLPHYSWHPAQRRRQSRATRDRFRRRIRSAMPDRSGGRLSWTPDRPSMPGTISSKTPAPGWMPAPHPTLASPMQAAPATSGHRGQREVREVQLDLPRSWGTAQGATTAVAYLLQGGAPPGYHNLIIDGCTSAATQSAGIELTLYQDNGVGSYTNGTISFTDDRAQPGAPEETPARTSRAYSNPGEAVEGTFTATVSSAGDAGETARRLLPRLSRRRRRHTLIFHRAVFALWLCVSRRRARTVRRAPRGRGRIGPAAQADSSEALRRRLRGLWRGRARGRRRARRRRIQGRAR